MRGPGTADAVQEELSADSPAVARKDTCKADEGSVNGAAMMRPQA